MTARATDKLDIVQVLRAFAAGVVVLSHAAKEIRATPQFADSPILGMLGSGSFGVDLFFVVSGFIIYYISRKSTRDAVPSKFIIRRVARIVPTYWVYTTAFLATLFVLPGAINHDDISLGSVIASYFFIPYEISEYGEALPVFALGWTLNYEMYFYVVFTIAMFISRKYLLHIMVGFFVVVMLAGAFIDQSNVMLWFWSRSNVAEFLYGLLIARVFLSGWRLPGWMGLMAVGIGIAAWQAIFALVDGWGDPNIRGFLYGPAAAAIVAGGVLTPAITDWLERTSWARLLIPVGDASYSLYLGHMFCIRAVTLVMPATALGVMYPVVFMTLAMALSVAVSMISYRLLERPTQRAGAFIANRLRPTPAAVGL